MERDYENMNLVATAKLKKIICVDCFDTILYRTCTPGAVLDRWFYIIAEKYDINYENVKKIWKYSTCVKNEGRDEENFLTVAYNMYNRFQYMRDDLPKFEMFYNFILDTYIQIEISVLQVNEALYNALKKVHAEKKIYLVSDFYMPREFFDVVFSKLKINDLFDDIFVSSDVGYRKNTGAIFDWLLEHTRLEARDILMIGDNEVSDFSRPKEKGMDAFNVKKIRSTNVKNINWELWNRFEINLKTYPLANYAFSLFLFMHELIKYVTRNHVDKLYFCSREGEFFKRAFDLTVKQLGISENVKTYYLLVSRKATFLPSLNENIQKERFDTLRRTTNSLSINEFANILGLNMKDFLISQTINTESLIDGFFDSKEFFLLINDKEFAEKYKKAVLDEKKEFRKYLETIDINQSTEQITLVDIGWRGTIQDNLYSFFTGSVKLNGLYYGIELASNLNVNNKKYGLVYTDVPVKSQFFNVFSTNHRMLERILQASHGTANNYQDGKCSLALLKEEEKRLYNLMKQNREVILDTIESLNLLFEKNKYSDFQVESIIAYLHETYLLCYTKKLYKEERETSNLMLMTFGTDKANFSYKAMLKSIIRMPRVELLNKLLKAGRRVHCNVICDIIIEIIYAYRKRQFLKMEI